MKRVMLLCAAMVLAWTALARSEDKIDADEPFRGVLNEGDLVAFSVDGKPVPLTVLGS